MAYTASYSATDLGNIFIDLFGIILVALAQNAGVLVVLLIIGLLARFGGDALRAIFGILEGLR